MQAQFSLAILSITGGKQSEKYALKTSRFGWIPGGVLLYNSLPIRVLHNHTNNDALIYYDQ